MAFNPYKFLNLDYESLDETKTNFYEQVVRDNQNFYGVSLRISLRGRPYLRLLIAADCKGTLPTEFQGLPVKYRRITHIAHCSTVSK